MGVPAAFNTLVARRASRLLDATWGSGDVYTWHLADVAYQHLGEGPPMVLLHAFGPGHGSSEWRRAAEELAPNFEIFAPDLPGWGQSDAVTGALGSGLYLQWLRDFLAEVVAAPAVIVAAGLPAAYAVQVAVEQPERVAALALVVPLGLDHHAGGPETRDVLLQGFLRLPVLGTSALNIFTSRASIATYLRRDVFACPELVDDALLDLHYLNSHRPGAQRTLAAYLGGFLDHDAAPLLDRISVPTWIAWGRRASSPPVEAADRWVSRVAGAELEVFEQAGLLPHMESPGEFGRKLEAFLFDREDSEQPAVDAPPPQEEPGGG